MNCVGTPPKRWDQGSFPGPHRCPSYIMTPSQDERRCLASFSLSQALFHCIFQHEEACEGRLGGCLGAVQPYPGLGVLGPGWAGEDTCSWASSEALLIEEEVPKCIPCRK